MSSGNVDVPVPTEIEKRPEAPKADREPAKPEAETIESLKEAIDRLDRADLGLVRSTLDRVVTQRNKLIELIKNAKSGEERALVIANKKEIDSIWNRLGAMEAELTKEDPIAKIPREKERRVFSALVDSLPTQALRDVYKKNLELLLLQPNDVKVTTGVQGLIFELMRIAIAKEQGLETVSWAASVDSGNETYPAMRTERKKGGLATATNEIVDRPIGTIQLDVPIVRTGDDGIDRVFVYETKSSPRMQYGSDAEQRNQLIKYQEAVRKNLVAGAVVEISGRIDPTFLKWALGTGIEGLGPIPNVEIVYTLPLPSGKEYRFPLKQAPQDGGNLRFANDDVSYSDADRRVIAGLQYALKDRAKELVVRVLTETNIENPSAALAGQLGDPQQITDLAVFGEYEQKRLEGIFRTIEAISQRPVVNETDKDAAYRAEVDRPYIEKMVRQYQEFLRENPSIAKAKKTYVLPGKAGSEIFEASIARTVDHMAAQVEKIRANEQERAQSEEERARRAERIALGYDGPPEGVALDLDHVMLDAIQELFQGEGKKGRSYENPESRFFNPGKLREFLANPALDRRYRELSIQDPLAGAEDQRVQQRKDLGDQSIRQIENGLIVENLKRADKILLANSARKDELRAKQDLTPEETLELRRLDKQGKTEQLEQKNILALKEKIQALPKQKGDTLRQTTDNAAKQSIAAEFDAQILDARTSLTEAYKKIIGKKEWDESALKIRDRVDRNVIKFIYVVTNTGDVRFDEEKFGGPVTGRAAHSELAAGENVYGGGEIAFEKQKDGTWKMTEINNGSGHYRPSGKTLDYVKSSLGRAGFDVKNARRIDALMRIDLEAGQELAPTVREDIQDLSLVA